MDVIIVPFGRPLLRGSVRGEGIKETDTDCSMSVVVAGGGLEPPASGL